MAQQHNSGGSSDDVRFLSRHEIISATVSDALVMIASLRVTLLAGGIAGALAPLAFAVPVALAVGLWPILNSLLVALMAGALLFAIVLIPLVILSGFWERMRTFQIIEIAAGLILIVVVIIAVLTIRNSETPNWDQDVVRSGPNSSSGGMEHLACNIRRGRIGSDHGAPTSISSQTRRVLAHWLRPHRFQLLWPPPGLVLYCRARGSHGCALRHIYQWLDVCATGVPSLDSLRLSLLGLLGTLPHAYLGHDHGACRVVSQKPCPRESLGG